MDNIINWIVDNKPLAAFAILWGIFGSLFVFILKKALKYLAKNKADYSSQKIKDIDTSNVHEINVDSQHTNTTILEALERSKSIRGYLVLKVSSFLYEHTYDYLTFVTVMLFLFFLQFHFGHMPNSSITAIRS